MGLLWTYCVAAGVLVAVAAAMSQILLLGHTAQNVQDALHHVTQASFTSNALQRNGPPAGHVKSLLSEQRNENHALALAYDDVLQQHDRDSRTTRDHDQNRKSASRFHRPDDIENMDGDGDGEFEDGVLTHSAAPPSFSLLSKKPPWPFRKASDARIYFVHIGKAGGRSLYQRLFVHQSRFRLECRMDAEDEKCFDPDATPRTYDSLLSKRLYGHFHMANPRYSEESKAWLRNNTNLLLVTVRDPVDRIISSFNYHFEEFVTDKNFKVKKRYHRSNIGGKVYMECFRNVEALARAMDPKSSTATTSFCRKLGRDLLEGSLVPTPCQHFHYNYYYYANVTWADRQKAVAVLRTESLWNDVARTEELLGGDPQPFLVPENQERVTHGSENYKLTSGVSRRGAFLLCCVLWAELQVYYDLVMAAVNLKSDEKIDTLRRSMKHCGVRDRLSPPGVASWRWNDWYRSKCPVERRT